MDYWQFFLLISFIVGAPLFDRKHALPSCVFYLCLSGAFGIGKLVEFGSQHWWH